MYNGLFGDLIGSAARAGLRTHQAQSPNVHHDFLALSLAEGQRLAAQQHQISISKAFAPLKTFREELQKDTDEWLSGVLDLT